MIKEILNPPEGGFYFALLFQIQIMKTFLSFILFLLFSDSISAQCPWDTLPKIKAREFEKCKISRNEETGNYSFKRTIPNWTVDSLALVLQITGNDTLERGNFHISLGKRKSQRFAIAGGINNLRFIETAKLISADYNNDGLQDLKFVVPNHGCCGAYNYYTDVYYLLQKPDGKFHVCFLNDLFLYFEEQTDEIRTERDFNGDGKFEIITQCFNAVGEHNYWTYNLYHFEGYQLVNANKVADYPVMAQILDSGDCKITKRISRNNMKKFAKKLPEDYKVIIN